MATAYFADTWYWVALLAKMDSAHAVAINLSDELADEPIVTSQMVLDELLGTFTKQSTAHLRIIALQLIDGFVDLGVTVVAQTPDQFSEAIACYRKYSDKLWSLTDCASINIMTSQNIQIALTNDHHFEQAKFTIRNG